VLLKIKRGNISNFSSMAKLIRSVPPYIARNLGLAIETDGVMLGGQEFVQHICDL